MIWPMSQVEQSAAGLDGAGREPAAGPACGAPAGLPAEIGAAPHAAPQDAPDSAAPATDPDAPARTGTALTAPAALVAQAKPDPQAEPDPEADPQEKPKSFARGLAGEIARWIEVLFGLPAVFVRLALTPKDRREAGLWLRAFEAVVRAVIVEEARALAAKAPAPQKTAVRVGVPRAAKPPVRLAPVEEVERSETWSVRFPLIPGAGKPGATPVLGMVRQPLADPVHRLARRYEAALRALENRTAYARRLARRLGRKSVRRRLVDAVAPPPPAAYGRKAPVLYEDERRELAANLFDST